MNVQLPPVLFYGIGALLVIFGALRAIHLGWQRNDRRHKMWGLLWVGMGIFLIVSTIIKLPR
jgi:uncharacterized membrane protein HdeD (DUF308 family)